MNIFDNLNRRHHDQPATTPPTGGTMKLGQLAADVHDSVTEGRKWLDQAANDKLPALAAEVTRLQGSLIVQALEGVVLTPEAETHIAGIITAVAAHQQQSPMANPDPQPEQPAA